MQGSCLGFPSLDDRVTQWSFREASVPIVCPRRAMQLCGPGSKEDFQVNGPAFTVTFDPSPRVQKKGKLPALLEYNTAREESNLQW